MDVVKMRVVMVIACHWDCWSRDGDPLIIQVMILFSLFSFLLVNRYLCCEWSGRARSSFRSRFVDAVAVVAVTADADADADDADNIPEMSKKCHNRKPSVLPLRATQKTRTHSRRWL